MTSILQNINSNIIRLNGLVIPLDIKFDQFRDKVENDLQMLRDSMDSLNHSISNLSTRLQEHKQQTAVELANLNISYQLENIKDDVTFIREQYKCGDHGWRRVAYLNMTDPSTTCPSGWQLTGYSKRTCGRVSTGDRTCDSATFPVSGGQYNRICGRITAYQWGQPDAFGNRGRSIDEAYACGLSMTHGTPRNHIWTFAAGESEGNHGTTHSCPCDSNRTITIPQFVGNDYFCESGINGPYPGNTFQPNDPLWDGEDCLPSSTCCSLHNPPYFVKQLPTSTTDDIEARICVDDPISGTNIAVELVELYVQ